MSAAQPPALTLDAKLKLPDGTAIAVEDDHIVVSGVAGTKTISGETAPLSRHVLEASDGDTPLREAVDAVGDEATTVAIAEALRADGVVYPVELLAPFGADAPHRSLLESLLLAREPAARPAFAGRVRSLSVAFAGDPTVSGRLRTPLDGFGCTVDGPEPDVIVFAETDGTDSRERVNREWLASDATLVRVQMCGSNVELGPVLTPSNVACLACLTTREELNGSQRAYETVVPEPTYDTTFLAHAVTRLTLQAGLDAVPSAVVGHVHRFDLQTLSHERARLLAVPGCEACHGGY